MSVDENGTRKRVFLALVENGDALSPSEISDEIGETRQVVKYHLDQLVDRGLVVGADGEYRCQPVFTDDAFEASFVEVVAGLVTDVNERIIIDPDVPPEQRTNAVFNCIRMFVTLELLEPFDGEGE